MSSEMRATRKGLLNVTVIGFHLPDSAIMWILVAAAASVPFSATSSLALWTTYGDIELMPVRKDECRWPVFLRPHWSLDGFFKPYSWVPRVGKHSLEHTCVNRLRDRRTRVCGSLADLFCLSAMSQVPQHTLGSVRGNACACPQHLDVVSVLGAIAGFGPGAEK